MRKLAGFDCIGRRVRPYPQANQTIGIELPLKALIWQDRDGKTWLDYNDPSWPCARHGVENDRVVKAMRGMLAAVAATANA
jgi:uncharacterized protein (DUF302 family)